jgi:hypothetical protein
VSGRRRNGTPRTVTARVMSILSSFSKEHPILGLPEISRRTGLSSSTTHRLTTELTEWGASPAPRISDTASGQRFTGSAKSHPGTVNQQTFIVKVGRANQVLLTTTDTKESRSGPQRRVRRRRGPRPCSCPSSPGPRRPPADNNVDNNAHGQQRRRRTWTTKYCLVEVPRLYRGQS